ncbi:MAG: MFS transporter [Crinalium sp.]
MSFYQLIVLKVFWQLEPPQRRSLMILFAAGLFFWSSMGSLLPTLPPYVADIGGTAQQVGIVMGAFAIGLLGFRPWLGRMVDQRSRKLVLLIGAVVAAIAPLCYLFVQSIPLLIAIRIFHGISIAAWTTAYSALVVDLSPISHRGELIGYMSLVTPIGIAIGPAIGGLLQGAFGYQPLFLFAAASGMLAFLGGNQIQEPKIEYKPDTSSQASTKQNSRNFWQILASPPLLVPSIVLLLFGLAFGALSTFVPLFIRETKIDFNAGWFYTAAAIASFSSRLLIGRASDRYGRGLFITASIGFYALAMLILSQANSPNIFLLAGVLEGAGAGTLMPMMITLLSDRCSPQERGRVFAVCISGFDLGIAIAGGVLGSVVQYFGYRGIFIISTGLVLLALIIFMTRSNKNLANSWLFAWGKAPDIYALNYAELEKHHQKQ